MGVSLLIIGMIMEVKKLSVLEGKTIRKERIFKDGN